MSAAEWKNIYIFISSTFSDMHAERDYLVRYVFPQLREWCAERHMYLNDIDLRWGVTASDAENGNTVEVCLNRIDESRPFFVCFLGQRRGTVFAKDDIADESLRRFPELNTFAGRESVTEIEIEHALFSPMAHIVADREIRPKRAERALFFIRRDCFSGMELNLAQKQIYTNLRAADPKKEDRLLADFKQRIRSFWPNVREYSCRFDPNLPSPELETMSPEAAIGRLCDFSAEGEPLSNTIIRQLQLMILKEYPERFFPCDDTVQSTVTEIRKAELANGYLVEYNLAHTVKEYLAGNSRIPLLIRGDIGTGKSAFLSYIAETTVGYTTVLRFCARERMADIWRGIASLWDAELAAVSDDVLYGKLCSILLEHAPILILLDDVTKANEGMQSLRLLPKPLPPQVKLVLSITEDTATAPQADYMVRNGLALECRMSNRLDSDRKKQIIERYLARNFKALDDVEKKMLVDSPLTDNPLFLTIILRELRTFGVFERLQAEIESFGTEPKQAFTHILSTLEKLPRYTETPAAVLVPFLFGVLSVSRRGIRHDVLVRAFQQQFPDRDPKDMEYYLRAMRPYLNDFGTVEIIYEGLRNAAAERYAGISNSLHSILSEIYKTENPAECSYHLRAINDTEQLKELYADPAFWLHFIQKSGGYTLLAEIKELPEGVISDAQASVATACAAAFTRFPDRAGPLLYQESTDPGFRKKTLALCKKPFLRFEPVALEQESKVLQPVFASRFREIGTLQCAAPEAQLMLRLVGGGLVEVVSMTGVAATDRFRIDTEAPLRILCAGDASLFAILTSSKELLIYDLSLENGRFLFMTLLHRDTVSTIRFGGPCAFATADGIIWQDNAGLLKQYTKNGLLQFEMSAGRLCGAWYLPEQLLAFKEPDGYTLHTSRGNTPESAKLTVTEKPLSVSEFSGEWIVATDSLCLYRLEKRTLKLLGKINISAPVCSMAPIGGMLLLADIENRFSLLDKRFQIQCYGRLSEDAYINNTLEIFSCGDSVFCCGDREFGSITLMEQAEKHPKAMDYRRFRVLNEQEQQANAARFSETGHMHGGYSINQNGILTTPEGNMKVPASAQGLYHMAVFNGCAAVLSIKAVRESSMLSVYRGTKQLFQREIWLNENVVGLIEGTQAAYLLHPDALTEINPEDGFAERKIPFKTDNYAKSPSPVVKDGMLLAYHLPDNCLHLIDLADAHIIVSAPMCRAIAELQPIPDETKAYLLTDTAGQQYEIYLEV